MTFEQEKDRESRAGVFAVTPQDKVICQCLGNFQNSAYGRVQQDILIWKHGYEVGLREGLDTGPAHPAVQRSVERMFGGWQGVQAAREQSARLFWEEQRGAA